VAPVPVEISTRASGPLPTPRVSGGQGGGAVPVRHVRHEPASGSLVQGLAAVPVVMQ
jgi:hypothetical protein